MSRRHLGRVVGGSTYLGLGRVRAAVMLGGLMMSLVMIYVHLALFAAAPAALAATVVFTPWRGRLLIDWVSPITAWVTQRQQAPLPELVGGAGETATMELGPQAVAFWRATAPRGGSCATRPDDLEQAQESWAQALDLAANAVRQVTWVAVLAPAGEQYLAARGIGDLVAQSAPMEVFIGARVSSGSDPRPIARRFSSSGTGMVALSAEAGAQVLAGLGVGAKLVNGWAELGLGDDVVRSWAFWAWPHGELDPTALTPLLAARSGCRQSLAIHLWPVPPGAAVRKARQSRAVARTRAATRAQIGSMDRLEDSWESETAAQREADTLSGYSLWHMSGLVSLRAATREALAAGAEELSIAATRANIGLRPMCGQQADAWRASLPLGLAGWREVA
ncbi:MAG: SCO6880 family protein [Acidimicrobiales bacterium]